jgi:DNA repair exonuclease SbcCD ATPase subunit
MRLHLKNFRCYEDKVFDFGENGLTLLSGPSGVGKSTIMIAIHFVLFGTGTKLQTHGKKSCSVEMSLDDIKIIRSKGPVRLIVNDMYEDAAGEAIIQEKFGKLFSSVSYIPQDLKESFVAMTPANRLLFLEKFAFGDVDISDIKTKTKSLIRSLADEHIKVIGNLEFASKMMEETEKPQEIEFPIKCKKDQREKAIKNAEIKLKNNTTLIKKSEREIKALETEKNETALHESNMNANTKMLNGILRRIKELEEMDVEYIGDDELDILKARLKRFLDNRSLETLKLQYRENTEKVEDLKNSELVDMTNKLKQYNDSLWDSIPKDDVKEEIENIKLIISHKKEYDRLSLELSKLTIGDDPSEKLKAIIQQISRDKERLEILSCPHCNKQVKFLNGNLVKSELESEDESIVRSRIAELEKTKKTFEKEAEKYTKDKNRLTRVEEEIKNYDNTEEELIVLEGELDDIEQYKFRNEEMEQKIKELTKNIENRVFSRTISSLEKKNTTLLSQIQELEKNSENNDDTINEEELRSNINREEDNKKEKNRILSEIKNYNSEKRDLENIIKSLEEKYGEKYPNPKNDIDSLILQHLNSIKENEKTIEELSRIMSRIQEYQEYEKKLENYNNLSKKLKEINSEEIRARKRHAASCLFRDKILETESIAISNMIENINSHSQLYLDHFFPDNPISVKLAAFKEGKAGDKPCINLEIDYRGIEHDLTMLSGGELSRVILAFTLALAEIHNSPIILLDECTASLDQDLTSSVITGLKDNFSNKLVVLIAHQVVQGVFDKVIKL